MKSLLLVFNHASKGSGNSGTSKTDKKIDDDSVILKVSLVITTAVLLILIVYSFTLSMRLV